MSARNKPLLFFVLAVGIFITPFGSAQVSTALSGVTPEVEITYSSHLDRLIGDNLPDGVVGRFAPLTEADARERTGKFASRWKEREQRILSGMQNALGLEFTEQKISVYFISRNNAGFSEPLILSLRFDEKGSTVAIAHEIAHRLFGRNNKRLPTETIWNTMFPGESATTQNHVLVFATLVYVFNDVLHEPELLLGERSVTQPDYRRAWEIVDTKGYRQILKEFRSYYQ